MTTVLLILHLFVTLALIGVVLLQRSEGGGLGIGSSQGMGAFMTGRGTANLLTRATAGLALLFFALSLTGRALAQHRAAALHPRRARDQHARGAALRARRAPAAGGADELRRPRHNRGARQRAGSPGGAAGV